MSNLMRLRADLSAAGVAWLQPLRDSEFLAAIKHRSAIPGGTCEFDLPDYFLLAQPARRRAQPPSLRWQGLLRPLCDAIAELLWLTRQNGAAPGDRTGRRVQHQLRSRDALSSCCASACRPTAASIRRSAAAITAAACGF